MGLFEILGDEIISATGQSAADVASNLIGIISPVVASGAAIYLIWYGFKVSHGQVANIGGNTLMLGLKIALISILILNAPNFMRLAEGGKNALESALAGALGANSTYAVFDGLYLKVGDLISAFIEGFTDVGVVGCRSNGGFTAASAFDPYRRLHVRALQRGFNAAVNQRSADFGVSGIRPGLCRDAAVSGFNRFLFSLA